MTRSRNILPKRMKWTPEMEAQLRKLYPNHRTTEVAEQMGIRVPQVNSAAFRLRLLKSREYLASEQSGRRRIGSAPNAGTFKPGHATWNKGMNYAAGGRSIETQFKPGQRAGRAAVLWRPIGHERRTKDGILQRKVTDTGNTPRDYKSVHSIVWEAAHGPIPAGHVVIFRPGTATSIAAEITPEKLELVSRAELMRRNSRHARYPKELSNLMQLKGVLTRKINQRIKENEHQ